MWLAQKKKRVRVKGHFSSLIFNARSSAHPSPTRPTVWGSGFNCPPIFPSLPLLRPPRLPLTGDGVFPPFFGVPYSAKILVGFRHPHFFFPSSPEIFIHHHQPYSTAVPPTRRQHCHYTCLFHKATLTTPSRGRNTPLPTDAEFQRTKLPDGF
jgi:hypothetical protein